MASNHNPKGGFRRSATEALAGVLVVAVLACVFFVFHVQPQGKFERERIYRSMVHVSRIIDDRTEVVRQAARYLASADDPKPNASGPTRKCLANAVICVRNASPDEKDTKGVAEYSEPLQSVADAASLPYPEAILLVMDGNGKVLAGKSAGGSWKQFRSLGPLIMRPEQAGADKSGRSGASADNLAQVEKVLKVARTYGRGEENLLFEGYPARLSRNFGGEAFAVFMAPHKLSQDGKTTARIKSSVTENSTSPARDDELIFAYLIPERVIDGTATGLSKSTVVNLLLALVLLFLSVPFLKLLCQSPLKPIPVRDLAAVMLALMLIAMTATLFVTIVLMRSSVTKEVETELAFLSERVANRVEGALALSARKWPDPLGENDTPLADKITIFSLEKGALIGAIPVTEKTGGCQRSNKKPLQCKGTFIGLTPSFADFDVNDRPYYNAWREGLSQQHANYVQFHKNKSNGTLAWSRIESWPDERVNVITTTYPMALRSPVLPRNFSFMIVLNTDVPSTLAVQGTSKLGDVQYHSDQSLSLIENVIEETRGDDALVAALNILRAPKDGKDNAHRRSGLLSIRYHGERHFAVVKPIRDTPWSVVALYDRTELLGLLAVSVVQIFFIGCLWVILVLVACWLLPRILRITLLRPRAVSIDGAVLPATVPIRGRSIWFFPNTLIRKHAGDGLEYRFRTQPKEILLQLCAFIVQLAAFVSLPPGTALWIIALVALIVLLTNYLMIARLANQPNGGSPLLADLATIFQAAMVFAAIIALLCAWLLGKSGSPGALLFYSAIGVGVLQAARWYVLGEGAKQGEDENTQIEKSRNAYIARALALMTVVVGMPTVCIVLLVYSVNLERYINAALITAAESASQQQLTLNTYRDNWIRIGGSGDREKFGQWVAKYNLDKFDQSNPGWFISGPHDGTSGIFSAFKAGTPAPVQPTWAARLIEDLGPDIGDLNADIHSHSERFIDPREHGNLALMDVDQYQPFRSNAYDGRDGARDVILAGGNIGKFALKLPWLTISLLVVATGAFAVGFHQLIRRVATILTGLYMKPVAPPNEPEASPPKSGTDPAWTWKKIDDDAQRAWLMALANSRTINFRDRKPIVELVENGYLALTPYVRIIDPDLAEYIRHDLPREDRTRIRNHYAADDDKWNHMRLPIIIAFAVGCALIAYTSPNTIQLVTTSFFALAAFLPLMRDPLAHIFNRQ